MFFRKNLYDWERALRVVLGLAIAGLPFLIAFDATWLKWLLVVSGLSFIGMGFIGFCPLCAMAGRKPVRSDGGEGHVL